MMRFFSFVILLILVGAVAIFAYQNFETVNVQWLQWGMTAPVAAVAGAGYLLGMLSGWSVVGLCRRSWNRVTQVRELPR